MSEIVSRVNGILEELSEYFNEVEFIYAFPDSELSSPLSEKYRCAVSVECRNTAEDGVQKESCSYRFELVAPVGMSGYEIFSKASDISNYIFSMDFDGRNISCTIGDISYSKTKRAFRTQILLEMYDKDTVRECLVRSGNFMFRAYLISECVQKVRSDIKVYGSSKPFDSMIQKDVYKLKIRTDDEDYISLRDDIPIIIAYASGDKRVTYSDCITDEIRRFIRNSPGTMEYEIRAYKRSVVNE